MIRISNLSPSALGALCAAVSVVFFSINDVAIKSLSGGYALHEVVLIAPLTSGWSIARTKRLPMHMLRALRGTGVPVFAPSNFGIQTFAIAEPAYSFLAEFDHRYISGHLEVFKADAAIYEILEQDCAFDPATLLLSDDRIDNINVAAERGWQTHLFDGPKGWADCLVAQGLLTKEAAL